MASTEADHWELWAISPLDGRYRPKLAGLGAVVSEGGLIGYRTQVEAEWLLHLATVPRVKERFKLSAAVCHELGRFRVGQASTGEDWQLQIKAIEKTTNHDVKAVEYFLQERLRGAGAGPDALAFVHFACTSEDINNLAYALMLRDLRRDRLLPLMAKVTLDLAEKAGQYADLAMLGRTHGQTATPTTMGKEMAVFGHRLVRQYRRLSDLKIEGKINGAVGNYNAQLAAFPDVDWAAVAKSFVEQRLGLTLNPLTTQIENHDSLVEYAQIIHHFNAVLIGLCRDLWSYISIGYFRQKLAPSEVGSSTMPHKVNPIDFENAEGNLGLANALASHFADKLPVSRWQRDLSDSTVLRTIGTLVGHSELAWSSLRRGLGRIVADPGAIGTDLGESWEVLAEPVQTVMRRYGVVDAYDRLKQATRGKPVNRELLWTVIDGCAELPEPAKAALKSMTPAAYSGDAARLAKAFAADAHGLVGQKGA